MQGGGEEGVGLIDIIIYNTENYKVSHLDLFRFTTIIFIIIIVITELILFEFLYNRKRKEKKKNICWLEYEQTTHKRSRCSLTH